MNVDEKDLIGSADSQFARAYLLGELLQIPQFTSRWWPARRAALPHLQTFARATTEASTTLTPEARSALLFVGGVGLQLHTDEAVRAAQEARDRIASLEQELNGVPEVRDYAQVLRALLTPIGVPMLFEVFLAFDLEGMGVTRWLVQAGPVQGPGVDAFQAVVLRDLTGLGPAEIAEETPSSLRRHLRANTAALPSHLARHKVGQRVHLWALNVICGKTQAEIAAEMQAEGRTRPDRDPLEWVSQQVQEAARLLGAQRPRGRPPKKGVLRAWSALPG